MKLLRYGPNGHEMTGSIDDNGHIHDLSGRCAVSAKRCCFPYRWIGWACSTRISLPLLSLAIRRYPPADPQARKQRDDIN
jgi:hypothetical protein